MNNQVDRIEPIDQCFSQISFDTMTPSKKKRVAAYARVSADMECTKHSLDAQVSYYTDYILDEENWEFAGVYADYGISGTGDNRERFQQMLSECEKGKIDLILTKSISRFARNTVNLLSTVRHLKDIGVEVRFGRENISTFSGEGELLLTILASFAQEESRSISENVKWGIRKGFEKGCTNSHKLYGYRWRADNFAIEETEAKVVRSIYDMYLQGASVEMIQKRLQEERAVAPKGGAFSHSTIRGILRQEKYTGSMILQKTYVENHVSHRKRINHGEVPMYFAKNTHPAIVEQKMYERVQHEIERRKGMGIYSIQSISLNCFSGKIKCGNCGCSYRRHQKRRKDSSCYVSWVCLGKDRKGKSFCNGVRIPDKMMKKACATVMQTDVFQEKLFEQQIEKLIVVGGYWLHAYLKDGKTKKVKWDCKGDRIQRQLDRRWGVVYG